ASAECEDAIVRRRNRVQLRGGELESTRVLRVRRRGSKCKLPPLAHREVPNVAPREDDSGEDPCPPRSAPAQRLALHAQIEEQRQQRLEEVVRVRAEAPE